MNALPPAASNQPPDDEEFDLEVDSVFEKLAGPAKVPLVPDLPAMGESVGDAAWKPDRGQGKFHRAKKEGTEIFTRRHARSVTPLISAHESTSSPISLPEALGPRPTSTAQQESKHVRARFGSTLQIGVIGIGALALSLWWMAVRKHRANEIVTQVAADHFLAEKISEARHTLLAYLAAPQWEKKLAFVLEPDRLRTKIRSYYEDTPFADPKISTDPPGQTEEKLGELWFQFAGKDQATGNECHFYLKQTPQGPRLDWEALVGLGDMPWAHFCAQRPAEAKRLTVQVRPGNQYAGIYADETSYQAYELRSATGPVLTGYVERTSRAAQHLQKTTLHTRDATLGLHLRCDPQSKSTQVRILDVDSNTPR